MPCAYELRVSPSLVRFARRNSQNATRLSRKLLSCMDYSVYDSLCKHIILVDAVWLCTVK